MKRRTFIASTVKASGALLLSYNLQLQAAASTRNKTPLFPNGWLEITTNNRFIFTLDKAEIGQNVISSLSAIIAEELDIDYSLLQVEFPSLPARLSNPQYQPSWGTGGSSSVRSLWLPLRHAGAATRALFDQAASLHFDTPRNKLTHHNGVVWDKERDRSVRYADLISVAASISQPQYQLKKVSAFTQLGRRLPRYDAAPKTSGTAKFGIDITLPQLRYAALLRSPKLGGSPKNYSTDGIDQNSVAIKSISNGIAAIADSYWSAQKALQKIDASWQNEINLSSSDIQQQMKAMPGENAVLARDKGSAESVIHNADKSIKASYSVPMLAHAAMEPMNCTAWIHDGICEVWAPTQRPVSAQRAAQRACGYPLDNVVVHTSYIGGGFGRRLAQDYVTEVVEIAKQVSYPVKLIWSREDDIQRGPFRPAVTASLSASVSEHGSIDAWLCHIVSMHTIRKKIKKQKNISERIIDFLAKTKKQLQGEVFTENHIVEGAADIPYATDNITISYSELPTRIPLGAWRSVGHSYNAFFVESFMDELAEIAGRDPVEFRLEHMKNTQPRLAYTLEVAAEISGWPNARASGYYQGIASHACFGSYVTLIIEISINNRRPKLERIVCVADCGFVVDPDGVVAQLEGAVLYGLSAALYGNIEIKDGQVSQSNFHDYQSLRSIESPAFQIELIDSDEQPGGVGEIGTPPAAPALTNAWFAATGKRIRDLPIIR